MRLPRPAEPSRALFRALGLETVFAQLSQRRKAQEEPKVVLCKSLAILLGRYAVHILPMTTLVGLIWINYRTLYIGPTFVEDGTKDPLFLAGIQVASKLLELMCVASLTSIVMYALRRELLGDGVPLGLLGSGQSFVAISSLWSSEFLSAFRWGFGTKQLRRAMFCVLLILAAFIASVIGPASAVLMLPRLQSFPAGGANFWMNGTADDFWPDVVTAASQPEFCSFANATAYPVCPSGGYESLSHTLSTINYFRLCTGTGWWFTPQCQAVGSEGNRAWNNFLIQTPLSIIPAMVNTLSSPNWGPGYFPTTVTQPHAASVVWMQQFVYAWNNAALFPKTKSQQAFRWAYEIQTIGSTTVPWVRVRCTSGQNLSANAESATFPPMYTSNGSEYTASAPRRILESSIAGLDRNESAHIRTQWLQLPVDKIGASSDGTAPTGLLFELPWVYNSRLAVGCSIVAAWQNNTIQADRSTSYDSWKVELSEDDSAGFADLSRSVRLDESWLKALTVANQSGSVSRSANRLERLFSDAGLGGIIFNYRHHPQRQWDTATGRCVVRMMNGNLTDAELWQDTSCGNGNKGDFMELVLAMLVADGLSRYGSHRAFDIYPDLSDWQPQMANISHATGLLAGLPISARPAGGLIPRRMRIDVVGYSYYASTTSDRLALAVASLYLLIATLHIVWRFVPWHRTFLVSSSAWDTVTELLVLCQNSPPPAVPSRLRNTSAGIHRFKTYQTLVKVRVTVEKEGAAKLQLVVEDDVNTQDKEKAVRADGSSTQNSRDRHGSSLSPGLGSARRNSSSSRLLGLDGTRLEEVKLDVKYG